MRKLLLFIAGIIFMFQVNMKAEQPAFPGAEGGGMYTTGGRGGNVYFVTSLEDTNTGNYTTGEGTFRWCLGRPGPRTIVFRVAGIIALNSTLKIPSNTTIAGQTAPGDGICFKNYSLQLGGSNVIIRYVRSRMGDEKLEQNDAMWGRNYENIIIDHCSLSWSTDECGSFYDNKNFTLQWSILSESLRESVHDKGTHGYGGIWGGKTATFHHNLLAHHDSRNPRMNGSRYSGDAASELVDFRNNVIYNWGGNSGYAGMGGSYNFVNNYYKAGAASSHEDRIFQPYCDDGKYEQEAGVWGVFYLNGNHMTESQSVTDNNIFGLQPNEGNGSLPAGGISAIVSNTEFEVPYVTTQTAAEAYQSVLDSVGVCNNRDATDIRVINEVTNGLAPLRASNGTTKPGFIDTQTDVGGWDTYTYDTADLPTDADMDGMDDDWETANGLDPTDKADRNIVTKTGYTALEEYINGTEEIALGVKNVIVEESDVVVYPSPAQGQTTVKFYAATSGSVTVDLISISGKNEMLIANKYVESGINEVVFNADDLSDGIYLIRVSQEGSTSYAKVLVK